MITSRELPPSEWARPEVADLLTLVPFLASGDIKIVVIEDDGKIVGRWAAVRFVHLEGVQIDQAYRHRPSAVRALLQAGMAAARTWSDSVAMTGAADPGTRRLILKHLGGVEIPADQFWIPVNGDNACPYSH